MNGEWIAETPQGQAKVRITEKMHFGILNHYVRLLSSPNIDEEVFVPMRVVQNGSGSEVIFTVFQLADMSEDKYAEDIKMGSKICKIWKVLLRIVSPLIIMTKIRNIKNKLIELEKDPICGSLFAFYNVIMLLASLYGDWFVLTVSGFVPSCPDKL